LHIIRSICFSTSSLNSNQSYCMQRRTCLSKIFLPQWFLLLNSKLIEAMSLPSSLGLLRRQSSTQAGPQVGSHMACVHPSCRMGSKRWTISHLGRCLKKSRNEYKKCGSIVGDSDWESENAKFCKQTMHMNKRQINARLQVVYFLINSEDDYHHRAECWPQMY
jgi:hypothetical protein